MELTTQNYDIQDTLKCECGHEFDIHDINSLIPITNNGFYSNIVRNCSEIHCPKCNKKTVLLLKQKGQTWQILGIATPKVIMFEDNLKTVMSNDIQVESQNNENEINQEFICPVCKKACKNKIGLNAHMKTHNN